MICSISNQKGGVGKTTTSAALSAAIANQNKHVLQAEVVSKRQNHHTLN